jgi:hypothetical protein
VVAAGNEDGVSGIELTAALNRMVQQTVKDHHR